MEKSVYNEFWLIPHLTTYLQVIAGDSVGVDVSDLNLTLADRTRDVGDCGRDLAHWLALLLWLYQAIFVRIMEPKELRNESV